MKGLFFVIGLLIFALANGQGTLTFGKETHDFGQIEELDEFVEYSFVFVNSGNDGLMVSNVQASCGCTTPYWTKEEILPGDSGRITARYSTVNRPGPFNKTLRVTSNASNKSVTLNITGNVKPAPREPKREFPVKNGKLRFKYRSFNMGKITTERVVTKNFDVYNESDSTITFERAEYPDHLVIRFNPDTLKSKTMGMIEITYDPEKKNDLGYLNDEVKVFTNDTTQSDKEFLVIATIEEYFPVMTEEELATKPKLFMEKKLHDFSKAAQGDTLRYDFIISNTGMDTLKIRNAKPNCDCTMAVLDMDSFAPGEEGKLTVSFNTAGRKGQQFKNVTIFSNDPMAPTQMVTVKATVEVEE